MDKKVLFSIKFILFATVITHGIFKLNFNLKVFILMCLFFLLNNSFRFIIKNKKIIAISLCFDIGLCLLINFYFQNTLIHLLLLITMIDSFKFMKKNVYSFIFVTAIFYTFIFKKSSPEIIVINSTLLIGFILLFYIINSLRNKNENLEFLYDDVRRYSYELERAKKEVEEYSKKVEELTSLQERSNIASEIHDSIGHRLTALLIQIEAAVRISAIDNTKSNELMNSSLINLRESIEILRQTVHNMKPVEYTNLISRIKDLITKLKNDTNVNIQLIVTGQVFQLSPGMELVIYKNIQECITNSLKHGKSNIIKIQLTYSLKKIHLKIIDNGVGCKKIKKGMGLNEMENRTSFIGGTVEFSSKNGFIVETIIPLENP